MEPLSMQTGIEVEGGARQWAFGIIITTRRTSALQESTRLRMQPAI